MAANASQQNYMSAFSLIIRDVVFLVFSVVRKAMLSSSVYGKLQLFFHCLRHLKISPFFSMLFSDIKRRRLVIAIVNCPSIINYNVTLVT